jgi:hypothetical protein
MGVTLEWYPAGVNHLAELLIIERCDGAIPGLL